MHIRVFRIGERVYRVRIMVFHIPVRDIRVRLTISPGGSGVRVYHVRICEISVCVRDIRVRLCEIRVHAQIF